MWQFSYVFSNALCFSNGVAGLSEELYNDGFVNTTSIDFSPVVVQQMSERYGDRVEMECMNHDNAF